MTELISGQTARERSNQNVLSGPVKKKPKTNDYLWAKVNFLYVILKQMCSLFGFKNISQKQCV